MYKNKNGFTLIEVLVVIGIIAILAATVLVAVNPNRQFAQARNSQRISNVNAIINAIGQNIADNNGLFTCSAGAIPSAETEMKSSDGYNIRPCLVPNYLPEIPTDPEDGNFVDTEHYNTGYKVSQNETTKRITVSAPSAELSQTILIVR